MRREHIVNRIKEIIRTCNPSAQAILYGSEARGDAREDSDIDLLILLDGDKLTLKDELAVTGPLYDLEVETGVIISPLVTLKKLWNNRPFKTPFYINVMNEGILL